MPSKIDGSPEALRSMFQENEGYAGARMFTLAVNLFEARRLLQERQELLRIQSERESEDVALETSMAVNEALTAIQAFKARQTKPAIGPATVKEAVKAANPKPKPAKVAKPKPVPEPETVLV